MHRGSGEPTRGADGAGMFWPHHPVLVDPKSSVVRDVGNGTGYRVNVRQN
jgi:hypothetical protein